MKKVLLIVTVSLYLFTNCGNESNISEGFSLSKGGIIYQKINGGYIYDILIDTSNGVAVSFSLPDGDKLKDYLEDISTIRSEDYQIVSSVRIDTGDQLSVVGGDKIDHIVFGSNGTVYVKFKPGYSLNKISLDGPPECENASDCQTKYGDPPPGINSHSK